MLVKDRQANYRYLGMLGMLVIARHAGHGWAMNMLVTVDLLRFRLQLSLLIRYRFKTIVTSKYIFAFFLR